MRLRSRKTLIFVSVVLAALLAPYGFYQVRDWQAGKELADLVADLDRTAGDWRLEDLDRRRPDYPIEKNAGEIIKKAKYNSRALAALEEKDLDLPPNRILPPETVFKLKECLENLEANVAEARKLRDFESGRFYPRIAPDVISTLVPYAQDVREAAMLLKHDITWQAQQANFEQAFESAHAAVIASRTMREELFLISHLVRLAILRETCQALERTLAQGQPPPALLVPMQRLLLEEADYDSWTPALEGERAAMHHLFQYIEAKGIDIRYLRGLMGARGYRDPWQEYVVDRFAGVSMRQSHVWLLRQLTDQLAARTLPAKERIAKLQELEKRIDSAPELARELVIQPWRTLFPFLRTEAKLRATALGLAAEQFRRKNERWPRTVEELTPDFLAKTQADPFTGEPFRVRVASDGIVIYSVGPDGAGEGKARELPKETQNLDQWLALEFRLWNVSDRRREK